MNKDQLWQKTLAELELSLSKAKFTTWFKNTFILEYADNTVILAVPNVFTKTWLENKFHDQIFQALQRITDDGVKSVQYQVTTQKPAIQFIKSSFPESSFFSEEKPRPSYPQKFIKGLNPKYSFDTFVAGKGNELAKAASVAVSDQPGNVYNPLFIYGGVGLGKTHLIQGIGLAILKKDPDRKVLYVTCETFTNDFIQAVSKGIAADFKHKYRSIDALLIDDIQFLAGKEGTQEEFFHTFNYLHQNDKQVVLSSDRPPKAIPSLENRLTTRFEWGMIVDIGIPDLETRIAILESKCKERQYYLDFEALQYIATIIQDNIRELEGALNRVIAHHSLIRSQPTLDSVKQILSHIRSKPTHRALSVKQVLNAVSEYYDIKVVDLIGNSRKKELVLPRQIAMFLMREDVQSSYPSIGTELGGRDHSTAMHAYTKIRDEFQREGKIREDIRLIRQRLVSLVS